MKGRGAKPMAHIREVMAVGVPSALARMLGSNRVQTVNAGGSSQEDAIPLTVNFALISTGVTGSGVRLGPASGAALTALHNTGPAVANLWPGEDDAFNDQGPNLAVALAPGQTALAVPSVDRWIVAIEGTDAGGGIPEAPSDNNTYGRRNSTWTPALALAGGVMVGTLTLAADPTAPAQAATKNYADTLAALAAPLSSPVFTGQPRGTQAPNNDNSTWLATTSYVRAQGYLTGLTLSGDAAGAGAASVAVTVTGLQGRPLATTAPANGQVLAWSGANNNWAPAPAPPAAAGGVAGQLQWNSGGSLAGLTMSGDASLNTSTGALTLAAVNSNIGTFQGITIDSKGRVTAASAMNYGSVTSITAGPGLTGSPGTITGAGTIALSTPVSVANGGTGLAGGASGGVPYYSAGTTMASSAQLAQNAFVLGGGAAGAPYSSAIFTMNPGNGGMVWNGNAMASPQATSFQSTGADGFGYGFVIVTNANGAGGQGSQPGYTLRATNGTAASPAAVAAAQSLGNLGFQGHDGSALATGGYIMAMGSSLWTTANHGTYLRFVTCADGSTANIEPMRLQRGAIMPATVAGGDLGQGTINVSGGYYIGGAVNATSFTNNNLTINVGGSTPPALGVGPAVQLVGTTNGSPGVQLSAYGGTSTLLAQCAGGTPAAPTLPASNQRLSQWITQGYTGSGPYSGNVGIIDFVATQAWTAAANGIGIEFRTTVNNSVNNNATMALGMGGLGGLTLPANVVNGDQGTGTINISGSYYQAGSPVSDPNWIYNVNHNHIGNFGGGAAPACFVTCGEQIIGSASVAAGLQVNAFAATSLAILARAGGTPSAPTALALNDRIGGAYFYGYDGSGYQNAAAITAQADQAYSGTARGTSLTFWGTPNNTTTIQPLMSLGLTSGGLCVPNSPTGGDMGVGTINVSSGYYVGGVNIMGGRAGVYSGVNYAFTTTTTGSGVMLGAGVGNMRITPALTGRVLVTICGIVANNTAGSGVQVALRYGAGTAPAQAAAATGTSPAQCFQTLNSATANMAVPYSLTALLTGLAVGTAYWFDLSVAANIGGTATLSTAVFNAIEL